MESPKAKAKKKSHEEKRRQKKYQNSAKEELKSELMEPSSDTFLEGAECQSEVDNLKAQMREEVEQLQSEFDLELEAEGRKAMEVQEESEQVRERKQ